ncbi:dipeptide epimerase [Candidatus Uabimicrobium amorphum]|uniref:Dipeptide epimerase n=1 Tax=Uabimicrobium amorphum TaxID=2596890 RepID=A0A5S9F5Y5_UABAM|nr:dipeptide epimerase [Candidatus Uabimicrobium amorphum]BBM87337.1 L-Ala-D/L-Glu epimerase [Candidatus Uabimicrobium amorphum]
MQIKDVKIVHKKLPLKKVFRTALRTATEIPLIEVEISTNEDTIGRGTTSAAAKVTGETTSSICAAIQDYIFPSIAGSSLLNVQQILHSITTSIPKNYSAKAAVDMAVYDLYCKSLQIPLYKYLGVYRTKLSTHMTVSLGEIEQMCCDAQEAVNNHFSSLKIKAGKDFRHDIEAIRQIYKTVGNSVRLGIDANQGWKKRDAVTAIRALQEIPNIDFVEQPVVAHDIEGLKWIKNRVDIPIMADESIFSYSDAMRVIREDAADLINIKLLKCGGIFPATKILHAAESAGIECMLGCMMEGPISIACGAMFACAHKNITRIDLDSLYSLRNFTLPSYIYYGEGQIELKVNHD